MPLRCDARLVGQALINIVKNAIESIEGANCRGQAGAAPGWIAVIGRPTRTARSRSSSRTTARACRSRAASA